MTPSHHRPSPLTRRRLLFGLGSAAGTGVTPPSLAAGVSVSRPSGSEKRITQHELDRIVARHQLWLDRKTGGELANLSSQDLSGLNFSRWDLRHASFSGTNLSMIHAVETRFCYCDFTGANLSTARMIDCDFRGCQFKRASLVYAVVQDSQTDWPAPLKNEDLWYCGGGMMDVNFDEADFHSAKIHVELSGAWLGNTNWQSADLVNFPDMDL